jgi:hypothetical protein
MKKVTLLLSGILCLAGCDLLTQTSQHGPEKSSTAVGPTVPSMPQANQEKRFEFPANSGAFPASSVALDTITGKLCKTYSWQDNDHNPKGLPLCSELSGVPQSSLSGATKAYRGFTYRFNGTKWVKGAEAKRYNEKTQDMDPWSDDQYDPLDLFTKEEKAKTVLTEDQIRKVADQFGVSYEEAREEAKQQGYQVSPKH